MPSVERKFRNILVCYNNHRCVSWRTEEEFEELKKKHRVDWFVTRDKEGMAKTEVKKDK